MCEVVEGAVCEVVDGAVCEVGVPTTLVVLGGAPAEFLEGAAPVVLLLEAAPAG